MNGVIHVKLPSTALGHSKYLRNSEANWLWMPTHLVCPFTQRAEAVLAWLSRTGGWSWSPMVLPLMRAEHFPPINLINPLDHPSRQAFIPPLMRYKIRQVKNLTKATELQEGEQLGIQTQVRLTSKSRVFHLRRWIKQTHDGIFTPHRLVGA